jgi:hypothetical protein
VAALTSGFSWAFWACGAIALAAVPVTFLLVRRTELAAVVASATGKPLPEPALGINRYRHPFSTDPETTGSNQY